MNKEKGFAATNPKNERKLHPNNITKKSESQIRVIHVMADGRIVDDIKGCVIPVNNRTIAAYRLIATHTCNKG